MKVLIEDRITGILTSPKAHNNKTPAVILLHGFGSDKDEVANTYLLLADKLKASNISSLRIDFSGFGESKISTSNTTIETLIDDAELAFNYIQQLDFIDKKRIGLCGFSLGAAISILLADGHHEQIKSLALISPAGDLTKDFSNYLGKENYDRLSVAEKEIELDLGWRKIRLKKEFIKSLGGYQLFNLIKSYKGAFLAVAGTNDFSFLNVKNYSSKITSPIKEELILQNCDHIFNAFDENKSSIQTVIDKVANWFIQTL